MKPIEQATTIAQAHQESLLDFLLALPTTMEAQIFYALVLGSALGMLAHYVRQWASRDVDSSLTDYLFRSNPKRTIMTVIGVIGWSAGEVSAGLFTTSGGAFVGWGLVILSGLKTGYAGDSIINKGKRPGEPMTIQPLPNPSGAPKPP